MTFISQEVTILANKLVKMADNLNELIQEFNL
ncbi:hypothetical protein SAMN04488698_10138 [Candidatus Frackibacter sp. WG12]|nr:hypothetical protein SAMN04515661_10137 [Candidatus Frackibacter sp. WG11]SEM28136.1 hypothetical protein SAMN04488698_10138 [Candidatus Frackibacter sp. WG12]SFL33007.1 hypothetical protein SAMN04488699_10139 [Candidatus Frackibacter sp. WG13]